MPFHTEQGCQQKRLRTELSSLRSRRRGSSCHRCRARTHIDCCNKALMHGNHAGAKFVVGFVTEDNKPVVNQISTGASAIFPQGARTSCVIHVTSLIPWMCCLGLPSEHGIRKLLATSWKAEACAAIIPSSLGSPGQMVCHAWLAQEQAGSTTKQVGSQILMVLTLGAICRPCALSAEPGLLHSHLHHLLQQ